MKNVNRKNKHLIISWLFVAFLFRNLYTSDLYSNLTKKPLAKNLPKSFKELILNQTIPILSTFEHRPYLESITTYDEALNDHPLAIHRRLSKAAYWLREVKPNELIDKLIEQGTIEIVTENSWKAKTYFPTLEKFAFIYEANNQDGESAAYLKPIIQAYEGLELYSNNEPPVLVSPLLFTLGFSNFFSKTFFNGIATL